MRLPPRVTNTILARLTKPGEAVVVLKCSSIGDIAPYELSDDNGTSYIFDWNTKLNGHILRIPVSIWMENNAALAHLLLDKTRLHCPMIPLFEVPSPVVAVEPPKPVETPAANPIGAMIPVNVTIAPPPETSNTTATDTTPMYGDMPLHEAVAELVKDGAARIKDVAAQLQIDEDTVKASIEHADSKAILGHAGWVKLRSQEG